MEGQGQGNGEEIPTPTPPPPPAMPMPMPLREEELAVVMGKKRGRPRKYGAEGFMLMNTPDDLSAPNKRGRGRPPGSGNRQLLAALGEWFVLSAGGNFTPHVVTIAAGEDVTARILSFSQKGPRSICILSANGAISNVTLRQPGSSGGTLTYEGRFEILSLSGSFTITENGGFRSRTGGISVSLAGPDGRVVGGGVAGLLLAAGPIQVVVGSFSQNAQKKKADPPEPSTLPAPSLAPQVVVQPSGERPISPQANPNPYDDTAAAQEEEAPQEQDEESQQENSMERNKRSDININPVNTNSIHRFGVLDWQSPPSEPEEQYKPSPDINISLPGPGD